jgi:hypothetical protein
LRPGSGARSRAAREIGTSTVRPLRCRWGRRIAHTRAVFAVIPGECPRSETDGMDPARYKRPRNGPRMCEQHPKSEERLS